MIRTARRFSVILASATLAAVLSACAMPEAPRRTALIYGVSTYVENHSGRPNLTLTDNDARSMNEMLASKGWTTTTRIADSNNPAQNALASKSQIEADIAALQPDDGLVLFYYSGHGAENIDGEIAICPYGSINSSGIPINSAMITTSELRAMFEQAGLNNVVIILDSCFSGGFVDSRATVDALPVSYGVYDDGISYTWFLDALGDAEIGRASCRERV